MSSLGKQFRYPVDFGCKRAFRRFGHRFDTRAQIVGFCDQRLRLVLGGGQALVQLFTAFAKRRDREGQLCNLVAGIIAKTGDFSSAFRERRLHAFKQSASRRILGVANSFQMSDCFTEAGQIAFQSLMARCHAIIKALGRLH